MRFTEFNIIEARRNPEQNPKISVNEYITRAVASAQPLPDSTFKNIFVSFTELPKLGINPGSHYNTPIGIYAYPGEYVLKTTTEYGKKDSTLTMKALPFAGGKPWANLFRARNGNNIVDLGTVDQNTVDQYYKKLADIIRPIIQKQNPQYSSDQYINDLKARAKGYAKKNTVGGHFWYVVMSVADTISGRRQNPIVWTELYRRMGIDGFVDPGTGVIHPSEPIQAVFFGGNTVDLLDTVANKYSPEKMQDRKYYGASRQNIFKRNMTELRNLLSQLEQNPDNRDFILGELKKFLDSKAYEGWRYFIKMPTDVRLELIHNDPSLFSFVAKGANLKEFEIAFIDNPYVIDNISDINKFVGVNHLKKLIKHLNSSSTVEYAGENVTNHYAKTIFQALNKQKITLDTEMKRLLIDMNPRIIYEFEAYSIGNEDIPLELDDYRYALKVMKKQNYTPQTIRELENTIYQYS